LYLNAIFNRNERRVKLTDKPAANSETFKSFKRNSVKIKMTEQLLSAIFLLNFSPIIHVVENVITFKDGKILQGNRPVLDRLDFSLKANDFVYLIGKTGSGKSSLLKTLYGELPFKQGVCDVVGFDMAKIKSKEIPLLRRKIGVVFQDFQLLMDRSVFDNLDFVLGATGWNDQSSKRKRINDMLELVGIGEKVHAMPHTLSGGEQQRVVIARALLNNPPLILADEPTGQLDPETSEEIIKLLLAVAREQQVAAFIATHDMTTVEKFPGRVFRIEEQTLKEISPLQEFNPFAPVDFNR